MTIDPVVLQLFSQSFECADKDVDVVTAKALASLQQNSSIKVHTNYKQHAVVTEQYRDVKSAFLRLAQTLGKSDLEQLVTRSSFTETISGLDEFEDEHRLIQALFASISEKEIAVAIKELKQIREQLKEKCRENYDEHLLAQDICVLETLILQKAATVTDFIACLRELEPKSTDFIPKQLLKLSVDEVKTATSVDVLVNCYLKIVSNFQHIPPQYVRLVSQVIPDLHAAFLTRFEPPQSNRTYTQIASRPLPTVSEIETPKPVQVHYMPGITEVPSATKVHTVYQNVMAAAVALQGVILWAAYQHFTDRGLTIHEITYALGFCVLVTVAEQIMRHVAPERRAHVIWGLWVAQALLHPIVMPKIEALSAVVPSWSKTDYALDQTGLIPMLYGSTPRLYEPPVCPLFVDTSPGWMASPISPTCPLFVDRSLNPVLQEAPPLSCSAVTELIASFVPKQVTVPSLPQVCYLSGAFEAISTCVSKIQSVAASTVRR